MEKHQILEEIRRTAKCNGGTPLGIRSFCEATGLKQHKIIGVFWARWSEAVTEAGFAPNETPERMETDDVARQVACLIRTLGHFPSLPEFAICKRNDDTFPNKDTIRRRLGSNKKERAARLIEYCREVGELDDVIRICEPIAQTLESNTGLAQPKDGFVYLFKSGKFYKIGRSDAPGRREYDLGSHRPEGITNEHVIKTDDPKGIEEYWHKRFRDKRKRGEWFDLSSDDVRAFKRRKFM